MQRRIWLACAVIALCFANVHATLKFKPDGTFIIVQFTDLHYGEGLDKDGKTAEIMEAVMRKETSADLIVLSGDMVSGYAWNKSTGWFKDSWTRLSSTIEKFGIPYASILGNHDDEADLTRKQIVELDRATSTLSLTRAGPTGLTGETNYWLQVESTNSSNGALRLWMLDSMDTGCGLWPLGWGCVGRDTLKWVQAQSASMPKVPAVAFVHIPIPQFMHLWNSGEVNGSKEEPVNCPFGDRETFIALRDIGVTSIHSGHDHNNNYIGIHDGVRLAYGQKSGFGSYGPPEGWLRGARVIQLREGQDAALSNTWIRLEDGSVLQQPAALPGSIRHQFICQPGFADSGKPASVGSGGSLTRQAGRTSSHSHSRTGHAGQTAAPALTQMAHAHARAAPPAGLDGYTLHAAGLHSKGRAGAKYTSSNAIRGGGMQSGSADMPVGAESAISE